MLCIFARDNDEIIDIHHALKINQIRGSATVRTASRAWDLGRLEDMLSKTSRGVFNGRVVMEDELGECCRYSVTVVAIIMVVRFYDRAALGFELGLFLMDINLCDLDS